jgi:integrase
MAKSTRNSKPSKPYPDFPLTAHPTRRWCKKIRGRLHYFGPWGDPQGALTKYLEQKDDLHAGRTPRVANDGLTVSGLCNRFLTTKRQLLDTGELSPQSWQDYFLTCERTAKVFGRDRLVTDLAADDFERLRAVLAKQWGPVRLGNTIQRVRSVFKFGYEAGLIDKPVRYGPGFKRPSRKVLRLSRAAKGTKMFEASELKAMLGKASPQLKAMILLAVNCGLGNTDCAGLTVVHLDLAGGWLNYPRPKTGVDRKAKLWPETVAAIRSVLAKRREPKDPAHADLVFLTKYGAPWCTVRTEEQEDGTLKIVADDSVSKETRKILNGLGINGHRNFYALRHTFRTIADESRDQPAVDHIMGHARDDMASVYRERISDDRLAAVANHVRQWLLANKRTKRVK